ncbi:unnamed protein product [Meloidogyne enterolobii]|uniref:Uncharacterized protein n=2 Tax=Meloidogyne enterolobii TaxID=390850 RepID=A0ACB0XMC6_MELEN|nr:unnamed protein product [Meloidogyne enterolobii]
MSSKSKVSVVSSTASQSNASNIINECRRQLRRIDKRLMEVQGHIRINDLENAKFKNQHELLQKLERLRLLILGQDSPTPEEKSVLAALES